MEEAGGVYRDTLGKNIRYNRLDVYNRNGFVALNTEKNDFLQTGKGEIDHETNN